MLFRMDMGGHLGFGDQDILKPKKITISLVLTRKKIVDFDIFFMHLYA